MYRCGVYTIKQTWTTLGNFLNSDYTRHYWCFQVQLFNFMPYYGLFTLTGYETEKFTMYSENGSVAFITGSETENSQYHQNSL